MLGHTSSAMLLDLIWFASVKNREVCPVCGQSAKIVHGVDK
jgi:hypothetical protein